MDHDTVLDQHIDKLRCGQKVGLIRRYNVTSGIPQFGFPQHLKVFRILIVKAIGRAGPVSPHFGIDQGHTSGSDRPIVPVTAFNGIHPHPPDVEQQRIPIS